jgi:spoIIIJ-associated protein
MNEEIIAKIKETLEFFLHSFAIAGEVIVKRTDDTLVANIVTGRPEILIGRNGQTLFALQQVVRAMLSRDLGPDEMLVIDVEGYRQKHNERVKLQAREAALKVLASGEPYHLPPMTSFERRLVHIAITDFADLEADSEGEGLSRHIVIKPKKS